MVGTLIVFCLLYLVSVVNEMDGKELGYKRDSIKMRYKEGILLSENQ